jgi:hypothetical protein
MELSVGSRTKISSLLLDWKHYIAIAINCVHAWMKYSSSFSTFTVSVMPMRNP